MADKENGLKWHLKLSQIKIHAKRAARRKGPQRSIDNVRCELINDVPADQRSYCTQHPPFAHRESGS